MEQYVCLDHQGRKRLREIFEVSFGAVSDALNFKTNTLTSKQIRHTALTQLGGKLKVDLPIEETIHDCNGFMTQRFSNGVILKARKFDGYTTITNKHGDLVRAVDVHSLDELESWQVFASRL